MTSRADRNRIKLIDWTPPARADVRRIYRTDAMRILTALHRFAETGEGDIKKLPIPKSFASASKNPTTPSSST